jgi:hypothetical protein
VREGYERSGIAAAVTDYVESWLDADPARMASCLHPALAKREAEDHDSGSLELEEAPFDDMVGPVLEGGPRPYGRELEITVFDIQGGDIAAVVARSEPFVDLLHLARFGDRWLIVNALYERRPAADGAGDAEAVRRTVDDYASSWLDRDVERCRGAVHPALAERRVRDHATGALDLEENTFDELLEYVAEGPNGSLEPTWDVRVHDVSGDIASASVIVGPWDIDLHLARFGATWLIVNILYRTRVTAP